MVAEFFFEELGNMDQTPIQHEMPVETTLEKRGAKDARIMRVRSILLFRVCLLIRVRSA